EACARTYAVNTAAIAAASPSQIDPPAARPRPTSVAISEIRSGISLYKTPTGDDFPARTATIPSSRLHRSRNCTKPAPHSHAARPSIISEPNARTAPAATPQIRLKIEIAFGET